MDDSPAVFVPVGCARNCVLTTNVAIAEVSTIGSGTTSEFKALSSNWNVSIDGLSTFDQNAEMPDVRTIQFSLQQVFISFVVAAGSRSVYYAGWAIIESVVETASYTDVVTYNIQLQGSGELFIDGGGYGDAPDNFELSIIGLPEGGYRALYFEWSYATGAESYTIRVTNLDTGDITYEEGITTNTHDIEVERIYSYSFAIRSVFGDMLESAYSTAQPTWDADCYIMIDSNGAIMIDSNGSIMANPM